MCSDLDHICMYELIVIVDSTPVTQQNALEAFRINYIYDLLSLSIIYERKSREILVMS